MSDEAAASMVDLAFVLQGQTLPREHRHALAAALEQALPWLACEPAAGVHPLNLSTGGGAQALLSRRTRLTLRLPQGRVAAARQLEGARLDVAGSRLAVGAAHTRALLPWGTLYAHRVASGHADDELAFLQEVDAELASLGVSGRPICGRAQAGDTGDGDLCAAGFSLMLDGLSAAAALRLLEHGLGPHRRMGCGLFVPHKSAAAVGAPP